MAKEPMTHHIEFIFQAIDHGLTCLTELKTDHNFQSVTNDGWDPDAIDPDRFNRMAVCIDGEDYIISVFHKPAEEIAAAPTAELGEAQPSLMTIDQAREGLGLPPECSSDQSLSGRHNLPPRARTDLPRECLYCGIKEEDIVNDRLYREGKITLNELRSSSGLGPV